MELNRLELSQVAFDYMIRTEEFIDLAMSMYAVGSGASIALPFNNTGEMSTLAQRVTGETVEVEDVD